MKDRLEFGKIPPNEYIGPTLGEEADEAARQLAEDPHGFFTVDPDYVYGPDWEFGDFTREDLEATQIIDQLNKIGLIKPGREIIAWASESEMLKNNQNPISFLIGLLGLEIEAFLIYRLRILPVRSFYFSAKLKNKGGRPTSI